MRAYSLKHNPTFNLNLSSYKSLTRQSLFRQKLIYHSNRIIRVFAANAKCFVSISGKKGRSKEMIVEQSSITEFHLTSEHFIVVLQSEFIGVMRLQQLMDRFDKCQSHKIILSIKKFKQLSLQHHLNNIIQQGDLLVVIASKTKTILINKYNQILQKVCHLEIASSHPILSIIFDQNFLYKHDLLFIASTRKGLLLYQIGPQNKVLSSKIIDTDGEEQLFQLSIISEGLFALFCNKLIYLFEKTNNKWIILVYIVPEASLITLHACGRSIITHQQYQQGYKILQYDLDYICTLQRMQPSLIRTHQQYYPLSSVNVNKLLVWIRGDQPFALIKPIYQLTSLLNHNSNAWNFQQLMLNQLISQLQKINEIELNFDQVCSSLSLLGICNEEKVGQLIAEYLSIFICLSAIVNPSIILPQQFILPFDLPTAIKQTNIVCKQGCLHKKSSKKDKLISEVNSMMKNAQNMAAFAQIFLRGEKIILQMKPVEYLRIFYDRNNFVDYLVIKLAHFSDEKDISQYRQLLTCIAKQDKGLTPHVYWLTNQPLGFVISHQNMLIKDRQARIEQNEIEEYVQRNNGEKQLSHFDLLVDSFLSTSIKKDQLMSQQQAFVVGEEKLRGLFGLLDLNLGRLYRFGRRMHTLHRLVLSNIKQQYEEWLSRSSYNQRLYKLKFKSLFQQCRLAISDKMIFEEGNLIDCLMRNYLLQLHQLCLSFNLKFVGKLFQKSKQIQFDQLLKSENVYISRIERQQQEVYHQQLELDCPQEQLKFKHELDRALWNMYLALNNIHQYQFQIYQHIRDTHFIQIFIHNHHSNRSRPRHKLADLKEDSRKFLQSLCEERKKYRIEVRQLKETEKDDVWVRLIEVCYSCKRRWLGDPQDLLEQLIEEWYRLSKERCEQVVDLFSLAFCIEQRQ